MPASDPTVEPPEAGFGIYVHWPFCRTICPYCDFNVHRRRAVDHARWRRALVRELGYFAGRTPGRTVTSIYFGGGTPSLMAPATVAAVIEGAQRRFTLAPDAEITLEANPSSADTAAFAAFRAAGVNRLVLGVQALDDDALAMLGRDHDAAAARRAIAAAQATFPETSFDLIYARPGQGPAAWGAELDQALILAAGHLSLYQLTVEPGTAFARAARRGALTLPGEDAVAELYAIAQERCAAAGLPAYEVSNHAAPGHQGRHNLTTWRYGEVLGIGPGAHGRFRSGTERLFARQLARPEAWLGAVDEAGHGTEAEGAIDPRDRAAEMVLMGLRLAEGVSLPRFAAIVGAPLTALFPDAVLDPLIAGGLLAYDGATVRATARGRDVLDGVLERLLGAMAEAAPSSRAAGTLPAGSKRPGIPAMSPR